MTANLELTRAQRTALVVLADGRDHAARRSVGAGTVLSTVAAELWRRGLATRTGASRTARPSNAGYTYRITAAGLTALVAGTRRA